MQKPRSSQYFVQKRPDAQVVWVGKEAKNRGDRHGSVVEPLVTLVDDYGGRLQIIEDDHEFVLLLMRDEDTYTATPWWPGEAVDALARYRSPRGL